MKRNRLVCLSFAAILGQGACASRPANATADASAEPRFQAVSELILADSGEAQMADAGRLPTFPAELKATGVEAGFTALFVVDTTGRAEYRTISFAPAIARPFQAVVCSYLRSAQFTPVIRDGVRRRALVINPWTFGLEGGVWQNRRYDPEPLRHAIIAEGLPSAVARLEAQPHC